MMNWKKRTVAAGLMILAGLASGCASNQDETPLERRALELEEDNGNLRNQLQDKNSVESALSRELEAKKRQNAQLETELGQLRGETAELRSENDRLRGEASSGANMKAERNASIVDTNGLKNVKDLEVIQKDDGSVLLRLSGSVMFDTAKDSLTPTGKQMLDRIANAVRNDSTTMLSIEGHTDARPLGKTKDVWGTNLALSLARAMSVHDYLKNDKKIADKRMRVVGYGEHRPVVAGNSEQAYARNRRVEILLHRMN